VTDDQILVKAFEIQGRWGQLRPFDFVMLAAIIKAGPQGVPIGFIRAKTELFGSRMMSDPSLKRLIKSGLITQDGTGKAAVFIRSNLPLDFVL
jgi:hypothetical protein